MAHQRRPTLTLDVLETIIDQANDTRTLGRLSLTCTALLPRARYHIFSTLTIQTLKKLESSLEFFQSHPQIRPIVERVDLLALRDHPHRTIRLLAVVPVHLLSQLPNLRVWCMVGVVTFEGWRTKPIRPPVCLSLHRCALSRYKRFGDQIQNLKLFKITFNDISDFMGLVSSFARIHTLTCSHIWIRGTEEKESTSLLKVSRMGLLAQSLKFMKLHLNTSVDILAVGYLLNSSLTMLNALTLNFETLKAERPDYFERLEGLLSGLPHLSTLTCAILGDDWSCYGPSGGRDFKGREILSQKIRCTTRILQRISGTRLKDVRVVFEMHGIDSLTRYISWSEALLEPCKKLEGVLLTFPHCSMAFRATNVEHRGRRAEFWRSVIQSAFPRLSHRGLLAFLPSVQPLDIVVDTLAHESPVTCLVASHDSRRIISASSDGTIIIWDIERNVIVHEWLATRGPTSGLALSPDSQRLVSAGGVGHGALVVWDISDAVSKVATLEGHTQTLTTCAWSSDGTLIASADKEAVRVWDALTFRERDVLAMGERATLSEPQSLQFSPDARRLAWISKALGGTLWSEICCVWRPLTGEGPLMLGLQTWHQYDMHIIKAFSFDDEGRRIAIARGSGWGRPEEHDVQIWGVATGAELAVLVGHTDGVEDVSFSPDGRLVLSASADGAAKIWDAESGEEKASFTGSPKSEGSGWERRGVEKARYAPDGKHVATASFTRDSKVQLWRVEDRASVATFTEHGPSVAVGHVVFSPDGKFLASGDSKGIVHIRRISSFTQH